MSRDFIMLVKCLVYSNNNQSPNIKQIQQELMQYLHQDNALEIIVSAIQIEQDSNLQSFIASLLPQLPQIQSSIEFRIKFKESILKLLEFNLAEQCQNQLCRAYSIAISSIEDDLLQCERLSLILKYKVLQCYAENNSKIIHNDISAITKFLDDHNTFDPQTVTCLTSLLRHMQMDQIMLLIPKLRCQDAQLMLNLYAELLDHSETGKYSRSIRSHILDYFNSSQFQSWLQHAESLSLIESIQQFVNLMQTMAEEVDLFESLLSVDSLEYSKCQICIKKMIQYSTIQILLSLDFIQLQFWISFYEYYSFLQFNKSSLESLYGSQDLRRNSSQSSLNAQNGFDQIVQSVTPQLLSSLPECLALSVVEEQHKELVYELIRAICSIPNVNLIQYYSQLTTQIEQNKVQQTLECLSHALKCSQLDQIQIQTIIESLINQSQTNSIILNAQMQILQSLLARLSVDQQELIQSISLHAFKQLQSTGDESVSLQSSFLIQKLFELFTPIMIKFQNIIQKAIQSNVEVLQMAGCLVSCLPLLNASEQLSSIRTIFNVIHSHLQSPDLHDTILSINLCLKSLSQIESLEQMNVNVMKHVLAQCSQVVHVGSLYQSADQEFKDSLSQLILKIFRIQCFNLQTEINFEDLNQLLQHFGMICVNFLSETSIEGVKSLINLFNDVKLNVNLKNILRDTVYQFLYHLLNELVRHDKFQQELEYADLFFQFSVLLTRRMPLVLQNNQESFQLMFNVGLSLLKVNDGTHFLSLLQLMLEKSLLSDEMCQLLVCHLLDLVWKKQAFNVDLLIQTLFKFVKSKPLVSRNAFQTYFNNNGVLVNQSMVQKISIARSVQEFKSLLNLLQH